MLDNRNKEEYKMYDLNYIQSMSRKEREYTIGGCSVWHDVVLKKWRLTIQLDKEAYYFLSVFIMEDGSFDMYSFDEEAARDSHAIFTSEKEIRKKLYMPGDEEKYLHEILIRYVMQDGTRYLGKIVAPWIYGNAIFLDDENNCVSPLIATKTVEKIYGLDRNLICEICQKIER